MTDTCIPEEEAIRRIESEILEEWQAADLSAERHFPHEFMYRLIRSGVLKKHYQIDPADSWLVAACEKDLPIIVPGWEDSTLGNVYAAHVMNRRCAQRAYGAHRHRVHDRAGELVSRHFDQGVGRVLPDRRRNRGRLSDLRRAHAGAGPEQPTPRWGYFCQISDSTTSYGSYSGAMPNEKITWGKLDADTPKYVIESDATIVAPLIFAYVLGE